MSIEYLLSIPVPNDDALPSTLGAAFTRCETCGGSGWDVIVAPRPPLSGMRQPCPDCTLGVVGHHGWELIRWCSTDEAHYYDADGGCGVGIEAGTVEHCRPCWRPVGPPIEEQQ